MGVRFGRKEAKCFLLKPTVRPRTSGGAMGAFFSREEVDAAVAPTPPGDKMVPPEAGYEEAETVAQLTGARHGLSPRALPRTQLHHGRWRRTLLAPIPVQIP